MESIESLFLLVLRASWHASIIVLIVIGLQWLFRRQLAANWRYLLWFAFLIRLALPTMPGSPLSVHNLSPNPFPIERAAISVPLQEPQISTTPSSKSLPELTTSAGKNLPSRAPERGAALSQPREPKPAPFSLPSPTQSLAFLWILVATGLILRLMIRATLFERKIANSETNIPTDLAIRFQTIKKALGLERQSIVLTLSQQIKSPCLFGFWRTRLIIPRSLAESLSGVELECVLLHELVHYKRHDILMSWVMSLLQYLHWFNPIVWFAMPRIRADREMATDAGVLQQANEQQRECYGELIIKLLDLLRKKSEVAAGSVAMVESKRHLQDRVLAIARFSASHRTPLIGILVAIGTLLAFMLDASPTNPTSASDSGEPSTEMTVTVMEDPSGNPIQNSLVKVSALEWNPATQVWDEAKESARSQVTDSKGEARVIRISDGADRYRITASHDAYSTTSIQINTTYHPLPQEADIFLRETSHVSGKVTDPAGNPIQDVVVSISYSLNGMRVYFESGGDDLITDREGRWRSGGVSEDINEIFVSFQHPEFALKPTLLENKTQIRSKRLKLHELPNRIDYTTLAEGSPFRGRVVDSHGLAITNAIILIKDGARHERLQTNSEGLFASKKTYTGPITGSLQANGYAPQAFDSTITARANEQIFALSKGQRFRFRFVSSKGNPIQGIRVTPLKAKNFPIASDVFEGRSNAEGYFEWSDAPDQPVSFMFQSSFHYLIRERVFSPSEAIQTITMFRHLQAHVNVSDQDGIPIPQFHIISGLRWGDSILWNTAEKVRAEEGKATLTELNWGWSNRKIEEMSYVYRIEAEGFRSHDTRPIKATEENVTLSVELQSTPIVHRTLVDNSGNPLPNKRLWLLSPHQVYRVSAAKLSIENSQAEEIYTDENGRFTVPNRSEPHSVLGLFEAGFIHQTLDSSKTFALKQWASLEGNWLEDGQGVEGITLGYGAQEPAGSISFTHFTDTTKTDEAGKFSFERVPATRLKISQIVASGPTVENDRLPAHLAALTNNRWIHTIDVFSNQVTFVELSHPQLHIIKGKIEIPPRLQSRIATSPWHAMLEPDLPPLPVPKAVINEPLEYRRWYLEWIQTNEGAAYDGASGKNAYLYVDDNGNFKTESIFPGKYRITFSYREKATDSAHRYTMPIIANVTRKIEITPNSPPEIDLGTFTLEELTPPTKKNVPDEL